MKINCPKCKRDLGEGEEIEIGRIGWICRDCNIKIYKELYNG